MIPTDQNAKGPGRKLGLFAAIALVMGNMIGSGVFLLPASLAPYGWNAVLGWIVTILGSVALAWSIARISQVLTGRGGLVGMLQHCFGKTAAAVLGWSAWVGVWTANATLAVAAVSYLSDWLPFLRLHPALSACALVWLVTGVSMLGLRTASLVQNITAVLKLVPLVAVIGLALVVLGGAEPAPIQPFDSSTISLSAVGTSVALTLWAMVGFEAAAYAEDAFERPAFTIPVATVVGTIATGLIYLFVCSAIQLLLDPAALAASPAPFAFFIESYWPGGPGSLIGLFAAIAAIGALNGWTIITGEVPRAMAQSGMLPAWFAGSTASGVPRNALMLGAICATLILAFNASKSTAGLFTFMALLSTCAALWVYVAAAVAALKLRIAVPLSLFGLAYGLWAMWSAGIEASLLSVVLMASGLPLVWLAARSGRAAQQAV